MYKIGAIENNVPPPTKAVREKSDALHAILNNLKIEESFLVTKTNLARIRAVVSRYTKHTEPQHRCFIAREVGLRGSGDVRVWRLE